MNMKLCGGLIAGLLGSFAVHGADYGLPAEIQDGNILHCFNWPASEVKAALPQIAAAGFGSVQLSPCQRPDIGIGSSWHDLYRPYDLAFKSSSYCSEQDLKDLCAAAKTYGIKVIVDVVANHVDKTAGYHDTWWDASGRVRWEGSINYGDRYSITHGQLGDYGDINSENADACARGKAYVQKLQSLGVKGIRWDAAKHIGLPSEGCGFWTAVTSVPGMYHYGEILDEAGPNPSIIKEYTTLMSVTDNKYCNYAARDNGGVPSGYAGDHVVNRGCAASKMVYWGESHDTYSNDEWSQNVDQSVIDRAYAAYACRNGATALYLSRPNTKGFGNIKIGKGSTSFTATHIAEVNKFRNVMTGKADYFESNGNACSVTRKDGGAVVVMKGSGNVTVKNGGSYCPPGTYKDRVAGGTFTVTSSEIRGTVGPSGIAVLYNDGVIVDPIDPDDPIIDPTPDAVTITGDYNLVYAGTKTHIHYWGGSSQTSWPGVELKEVKGSDGRTYKAAKVTEGTTGVIFNNNGSQQTDDLTYSGSYIMDDNGKTDTKVIISNGPVVDPDDPVEEPEGLVIYGDYNLAYEGNLEYVHYWGGSSSTSWPGEKMELATGSDGKIYKVARVAGGTTGLVFNTNGDANKTGDLQYSGEYVLDNNGKTSKAVTFKKQVTTGIALPEAGNADEAGEAVYFTLQGIRVERPMSGVYIRVNGNHTSKVIVH